MRRAPAQAALRSWHADGVPPAGAPERAARHWFDPFGRTEERRAERRLVEDYIALCDGFAATLSAANLDIAVQLAELPDQIRGYGHVKALSMEQAAQRRTALQADYRPGRRRGVARRSLEPAARACPRFFRGSL